MIQDVVHDITAEQARLQGCRQQLVDRLRLPADDSGHAVAAARQAWLDQGAREEGAHVFAREWVEYVANAQEEMAARYPVLANVVAAPLTALPTCRPLIAEPLDLVIVEDAHTLTESDLVRLSRWGRRWILVGDLAEDGESTSSPGKQPVASPEPVGLNKLWRQLHPDPSRLPYLWAREGQRWCCTLRPMPAGASGSLEVERLADFPEIELRIASKPSPVLVQVTFPANMDLAAAKEFILRELQEAAVQSPCRSMWLEEHPHQFLFHLAPHLPTDARSHRLEEGLVEWLGGTSTYRLEFSKPHWDRQRIDDWLSRHLRFHDLGRTFCLERVHRQAPALAECVGEISFGQRLPGYCTSGANGTASEPALVFHPVPALPKKDERRNGGNGVHLPWPREGAGHEYEVNGGRLPDRFPAEHRADVPKQGLINLPEAVALIRQAERWVGRQEADRLPSVAVIALYPSQAHVLRCLAARSDILKRLPVLVGAPKDFAHGEVDVVFLSLTRSHPHRAVSLGDEPDLLIQALTRARRRLFVFGDVGCLVRRLSWQGPLPPLDPHTTARETRLLARLLACLEGRHNLGPAFVMEPN